MKKILMLFAFLGVFSMGAQAQKSCSKKCTKAKVTSTMSSVDEAVVAKAASLDENIERRECAKSGAVSYYQKETCAVSGKVSYAQVNYDAASAKFVNVSPDEAVKGEGKASCAGKSMKAGKKGKACCASGSGKAMKASKKGKACCSGADKKASCSGKAKKASMKASSM